MKTILVTGCAGFIGSNLVDKLVGKGFMVVGVDNFEPYYDPKVKESNIAKARENSNFQLFKVDILNKESVFDVFSNTKPEVVIHLAAKAGVRPSIENPTAYAKTNIIGTANILEAVKKNDCKKIIYGSSSSVYGQSKKIPFEEDDLCQNIISPYGASKRSAEYLIESFYNNFGLRSVILRFFTVYGERGRPDMSPAIFTKAILEGKTINLFGDEQLERDFTYVGDIVDGIIKSIYADLKFEIINLGGSSPVKISKFISIIEKKAFNKAAIKRLERQRGDVVKTWANNQKAKRLLGWTPEVRLEDGIENYIKWLKKHS